MSAAGAFDAIFRWLESTPLSVWILESPSLFAFPGILAAHTIGLAVLAGLSGALDLRLLGVARGIPPSAFRRFLPVMWFGFWVNVISGLALLLAYPTKALTNPVFYLKLTLIAVALAILRVILKRIAQGEVDTPVMRTMAVGSLIVWGATITTGRLLAYTCTRLTVDVPC